MRVSVVRGGGIAGISTRTELASDALPEREADTLAGLVDRAGLRDVAQAGSGTRGPDQLLYELEVADASGEVATRFGDENLPDEVRELVAWIDARPERTRRMLT